MLHTCNIAGISVDMYSFLNNVSAGVLVLYVFSHLKAFTALSPQCAGRKKPAVPGFILLLVIYGVFSGLFYLLNPQFGNWFTNGNKNYYGTLTAWLLAFSVVPILLKTSPFKVLDLFSGGLPLQLVIAKLACYCWGCCSSFEMPGSFYYNLSTYRYEFPVQLVEAGVALLLFVYLIFYRKRTNKVGTVFPLYLVLYSVSRFLTEFLRTDLRNVIGPFDAYQIMSVVFTGVGLLLLWIVRRYRDPIEKYFRIRDPKEQKSEEAAVR